jgi:hypothetical protein
MATIPNAESIGAGETLFRYLVREKFFPVLELARAKNSVRDAIAEVTAHVPGCGGKTEYLLLKPDFSEYSI